MFTLTIDEVVNGFVVKAYDPKDGYILNEFHEEKVEALKVIESYFRFAIIEDLKRRQQNAAM